MTDIESEKKQQLLNWYKDLKTLVSTKKRILLPDDGVEYKTNDLLNLDGFYPGYFKSSPKVLFIDKESRDVAGQDRMETDLEYLKSNDINGMWYPKWQKIFYIIYGIEKKGTMAFKDIPVADEIKNECFKENRFPFAFINISKYSNDSIRLKSDAILINRFLEDTELDKRNFLMEQISILDPDVVITYNFWDDSSIEPDKRALILPKKNFSKRIKELSTDGISDVYDFMPEGKSIRFIVLKRLTTLRFGDDMGCELDQKYFYDPVMKALFSEVKKDA